MDPRWRLQRKFPGEGLGRPSTVVVRAVERDRPLREARVALGSTIHLPEATTRRIAVTANPRPNAPLLIRLVRYPFALHGTHPRRRTVAEPVPWGGHALPEREPVAALLAPLRARAAAPNPLRSLPTRPPRLERRPSVDAWLAGGGEP